VPPPLPMSGGARVLASSASTSALQQSILPDSVNLLEDHSVASTETRWSSLSGSTRPANEEQHIQKARDKPVAKNHQVLIFSRAAGDVDKARLLAAASPHCGDWLHAPPIASVGLTLSDKAVKVAVAHRLGCKACEPTPSHVAKQWTPEDFMVYAAEGVVLETSATIR